jgi:hypothetical protein
VVPSARADGEAIAGPGATGLANPVGIMPIGPGPIGPFAIGTPPIGPPPIGPPPIGAAIGPPPYTGVGAIAGGTPAASALPQLRQNFIPGGFSPRHAPHTMIAGNPGDCIGVCA